MHTLYCLPIGQSYRQRMLQELLAEGCDYGNETRNKLFILPNSTLFEQASREVLAKDPACLERVRILAFDTLVQEILAKAAIERRAMSRMAQECLVKQIIDDLIGEGQLHYFQEMRSFPGFIRTITSLIGEIKRSATSPAEWLAAITAKEGSPETHIKDFELTIIYQKYQQKLDEYKLLDLEESYFLASQALRDQPELFTYEILYFSEFYIFTPLQQELLDVLRQQCELKIALAYEKNRPEIYGPVERTYTFLVGAGFAVEWVDLSSEQNRSDCLNSLIQTLFTEQSIEKVAAPCIELVTAPHEAKELELVGSYIKKQLINGKRPDEIAILIRSDEKYPGLFALCKELSLPLDRRRDEPLMNQPLLKLLFAIIAAHMDGGSKQSVKTLLDSAFIANRYGWDREELLQKAAGVRLYQWQDWLKWLQAYPQERQGFLTLYETIKTLPQRARVKEFGATLSALMIELVPFTSLGRLYREGLPLERFKAAVLSYKAIISGLDTLSEELVAVGQGESSLTLVEYSKLLSQFFSLQNITLEEPFYGGIQVLSPAEARGVTFSTVCLLGLTEGHFPKAVPENWLYNDHERRLWNELGVSLPTAAKRREEEKFYFTVAVALAKERLYVSGIENQETLPSPFLAEIDRLTEIPPKNKRAVAIDEIFPDDYREIYSMRQLQRKALWQRRSELLSEDERLLGEALLLRFPLTSVIRNEGAAESRRHDQESLFGGFVPNWHKWQQEAIRSKIWSVSQLETYVRCPFAYFLTYLLQPERIEEAGETTEATAAGELYHRTLAQFMGRYRQQKLVATEIDKYEQELLADFAQMRNLSEQEGRFSGGKLWPYEANAMADALKKWLAYEVAKQSESDLALRPAYLEWSFGLKLQPASDAASLETPLILKRENDELALCGKVDRIDTTGERYAVYDYKKSSVPAAKDTFKAKTDLQLPLYILAVSELLTGRTQGVIGGAYYSIEGALIKDGLWRSECKNQFGSIKISSQCLLSEDDWHNFYEEFTAQLFKITEQIDAGFFPAMPQQCSNYCLGQGICRQGGAL